MAHEELRVFLGVNVIGNDRHLVTIAQGETEREGKSGLTRTDGAPGSDTQRRSYSDHIGIRFMSGSEKARVLGFVLRAQYREPRRKVRAQVLAAGYCALGELRDGLANLQQHALPGGLADGHALHRDQHLILGPRPSIGSRRFGRRYSPRPGRAAPGPRQARFLQRWLA